MDANIRIRKSSLIAGIALAFAPILALGSTDNGTLTAGTQVTFTCPPPTGHSMNIGYISGSLGSYSPTGLTGGKTLTQVFDFISTCAGTLGQVAISGFSSNPGSSWLMSVTCNGKTRLSSAVTSFNYSSGVATWDWSGSPFGFLSGSYSCSIVHT